MNAYTVDLTKDGPEETVRLGIECKCEGKDISIIIGNGWNARPHRIHFHPTNPPFTTRVVGCDRLLRSTQLTRFGALEGPTFYYLQRAESGLKPDTRDKRCLVHVSFEDVWPGSRSGRYESTYTSRCEIVYDVECSLSLTEKVWWDMLVVLDSGGWMQVKWKTHVYYLVCLQPRANGAFQLEVIPEQSFLLAQNEGRLSKL